MRSRIDGMGEEERPKSELLLERRVDGQLWAVRDGEATPVHPRRCFPWTAPGKFVSLRNSEEEEVALVFDPAELEAESRACLEEALLDAGFVLEVLAVEEIEEDFEIRCWRVRTRHGVRSFQTALDAWPRQTPGGGLLIEDVAGDLFSIPAPSRLDAASRKLLWAFVD